MSSSAPRAQLSCRRRCSPPLTLRWIERLISLLSTGRAPSGTATAERTAGVLGGGGLVKAAAVTSAIVVAGAGVGTRVVHSLESPAPVHRHHKAIHPASITPPMIVAPTGTVGGGLVSTHTTSPKSVTKNPTKHRHVAPPNKDLGYLAIGGSASGATQGAWDVPVGGMGALTASLVSAAQRGGAELRTGMEVTAAHVDSGGVKVETAAGETLVATHLLANIAPSVLAGLLGDPMPDPAPEGSQLKLNMVLTRLPRLRDSSTRPEDAFAGTFHVNESYAQLAAAYRQAAGGQIPAVVPAEAYCHSLTDASILSPALAAAGAQTLTVFALHMPARLFQREGAKALAVEATLASLNSVLAEPIEDCLVLDADGRPCLEGHTPAELEAELGLPGGNIFHRELSWPFAELAEEVGRWGVETDRPNVWICGAGARRGGGVSGIPGHNAAMAVLAA